MRIGGAGSRAGVAFRRQPPQRKLSQQPRADAFADRLLEGPLAPAVGAAGVGEAITMHRTEGNQLALQAPSLRGDNRRTMAIAAAGNWVSAVGARTRWVSHATCITSRSFPPPPVGTTSYRRGR